MNQMVKLGMTGAVLLGMMAGLQAEGKSKQKLRRQWVKENTVVNDRSKTENGDGSVTVTVDKTMTTKKGGEIDILTERTSTKNDDGTRSFTATKTATNEDGKARVRNTEGTVSPNGNGTRTVNYSSVVTRRDGTTKSHEGKRVLKNRTPKGKKK